ncbi:MAG: GNAT family N-acetyltransferase [Deltaproteobacteria bacterium]|nr:GNAT family N-acetyltransferase [Deltaproteobacteria bacterium]MBW2139287.1 GNAT family N-acetyltransferase [Deltaproteobacteria bacterium]
MDKIRLRRIMVEDVDAISRIQESITKASVSQDFKQIILEHAPKAEEASFVAEVKGRVVGYMISYILSGSFGMDKNAWIAQFGVDPKYMGQGIGKRLAEEIFGFYRGKGINNIFTSVRWDSTDLLSFFKTLGFDRSSFINLRKVLD